MQLVRRGDARAFEVHLRAPQPAPPSRSPTGWWARARRPRTWSRRRSSPSGAPARATTAPAAPSARGCWASSTTAAIDALRRAFVHESRRAERRGHRDVRGRRAHRGRGRAARGGGDDPRRARRPAARAAPGDRARLLRRLHPHGDRRDARRARWAPSRAGCGSGWRSCAAGCAGRCRWDEHPGHDRAGATRSAPTSSARCRSGEERGFEEHLAGCPTCRQEVADLQVAADALPVSARRRSLPPPALKTGSWPSSSPRPRCWPPPGRTADRPSRRERRAAPAPAALARSAPRSRCAALLLLGARRRRGAEPARRRHADRATATVAAAHALRARAPSSRSSDDGGTLVAEDMPPPPERARLPGVVQAPGPRPGADRRAVQRDAATARPRVAVPGSLDDVEAVLVTDEPQGGRDGAPRKPPVITAVPA